MIHRLIIAFLACTLFVPAQESHQDSLLADSRVFDVRSWMGVEPVPIGWTNDGSTLLFNWNPVGSKRDTVWAFNLSAQYPSIASDSLRDLRFRIVDNALETNRVLQWRNSQLSILNLDSNSTTRIIQTSARLSNFLRSGDSIVTYFDGTSLWRWSNSELTEMYRFTTDKQPEQSLEIYSQDQDKQWLQMQQELLFEHVRKDVEDRRYRHDVQNATNVDHGPKKLYVKEIPSQAWLSTDGSFVLFRDYQDTPGDRAWVPDFVTHSGYTERLTSLPKSVSARGTYTTNVYIPALDSVIEVTGAALPGYNDAPAYVREYLATDSTYEPEQRGANVFTIAFSPSGANVAMAIRSLDDNHRWITTIDNTSGELICLDHQYDSAWIDGPEIGWYGGTIGWTVDGQSVWYVSEKTGFGQLYATSVDNLATRQLTHVAGMVHTVEYMHGAWWGTASAEHPGVLRAFKVEDAGTFRWISDNVEGAIQRIHVSPTGEKIAFQYSTSTQPWNLFVDVVDSISAQTFAEPILQAYDRDFLQQEIYAPEVRTFTNEQGQQVWARVFSPEADIANGKGVVFVHGAGYLQNAHTWWSQYYREFFFHQLLREQGFHVVDVDFRGSKGYGRDWRAAVYRHMGGADLADVEAAGQFLVDSLGVERDKVGVYGGSYGGFLTLMAMFQEQPVFAAGAALRSVTDWAHYHPWYTRPRLNSPQDDSLAYFRSSPINFVENLQGSLLMCHGMVDVNVQFSDIVRLSQRLIELEKNNWELAVYPVEGHAFREPQSWRDEYRRILHLFLSM